MDDENCGVPSSDAVQKQVSPSASCRVLGKFDICVNFAVVISRGADKNTNFAKQLQDIVGLQETGKKKKVLDSAEIKLSTSVKHFLQTAYPAFNLFFRH